VIGRNAAVEVEEPVTLPTVVLESVADA